MRMWVLSLASLTRLRIWRCCGLWYRSQTQLRSWLAATAPIRPLAWKPPYAVSVALKRQKKKIGWVAVGFLADPLGMLLTPNLEAGASGR